MSANGSNNIPRDEQGNEVDPIWASSRTARQIYALGEVEKVRNGLHDIMSFDQDNEQDISRLLSLAASSISLLTLPQTDGPDDGLPQDGERSEQFVLEVTEYFERLDVSALRSVCLHRKLMCVRIFISPCGRRSPTSASRVSRPRLLTRRHPISCPRLSELACPWLTALLQLTRVAVVYKKSA